VQRVTPPGRHADRKDELPIPAQAPPLTDERELLLAYLAQQRDGLRHAAFGLTDEQARLTPTASALSVGGLLVHVAAMERTWVDMITGQPADEDTAAYEDGFRRAPDRTLADALAELDAVAARTEAEVRARSLDDPVPVPEGVPWFPADVEAWSVRWVLLHLIEELARHAGHADFLRESIDGATTYPLMAAAEGWPATEWLQPWRPAAAVA
jgi:uncharacterized damage-inducible protein DinB